MGDAALPRVLVVDDQVSFALRLAAKLVDSKFDVRVCHDGATALRTVSQWSPDTVLVDDRMPSISGREVCRRLAAQEWPGITMIYSAYDEPEDVVLALQAGATCHLSKRVSYEVLVAAIRRACEHTTQLRRLAAATRSRLSGIRDLLRDAPGDASALLDVCLGHIEQRLLCRLVCAHGELVPVEFLLREAWDRDDVPMGLLYERIRTLRRKLAPRGWVVEGRRGHGYRLVRAAQSEDAKHTHASG